jgi:hypothetical protein
MLVTGAAFVLGLWASAHTGLRQPHVVLGLFVLLLTCLIQVAAFTYLTVTGKLIAQATHLGGLPAEHIDAAGRTKVQLTRWVGVSVLACLIVVASGARRWRLGDDSSVHLLVTMGFLVVQLLVVSCEFVLVSANATRVDQVVAEYDRRRRAGQTAGAGPGELPSQEPAREAPGST